MPDSTKQGRYMNSYFTQYKSMLNSLEDNEAKTGLVDGLAKLEGIFDDAIDTRDKAKSKVRDLTALTDGISKEFSIDELTVNSLKDVLDNTKSDDELKAGYETKLEELRTLLTDKDTEVAGVNGKYEDLVFSSQIGSMGLLAGFKDNPMLQKQVVEHLKHSLIHQDGKLFVKDANGEIAKDIKTGESISPTTLVDAMKSDTLWADFVAPTVNQGGGMQHNSRQAPANVQLSSTEKMKQGRI